MILGAGKGLELFGQHLTKVKGDLFSFNAYQKSLFAK